MKNIIPVFKKAIAADMELTKQANKLMPTRRLGLLLCTGLHVVEAQSKTVRAMHIYALGLQLANCSYSASIVSGTAGSIDSAIIWHKHGFKVYAKKQVVSAAKEIALMVVAGVITKAVEAKQK